ncbi:MAG TPA: peptidoglycan DD-metalloendopeptidase family protein [Kribbella sp.]
MLSIFAGALAVLPAAHAGPTPDPRARKKQLDSEINSSKANLDESNNALQKSVTAYDQATAQLQAIQAKYAATQGRLAAAKAADVVAASKLKDAEQALATALTDVDAGEVLLTQRQQVAGQAVRAAYQQQNSLVGLSIVLRGVSPADLATGIQVQRNVFGIQGNAISSLNNAQAQLANKRAKVAEAARVVSAQRAEAARTVQQVTQLNLQVAAAKAEAAKVAQAKLVAYNAAERAKNADLAQYNSLVAERNRVQQILVARARAEKAAALAREQAKAKKEHRPPRGLPNDSSSLSWPINTYITSPYGMRFHPILHYWKLHDGTDFGGGCGTPIHAAASGVITDRYYNGGYGNRLFLNNGIIHGSAITTVYNHLSRYNVRVGQHVREGQVIGYVGTTGYSTGCHLHFMVYQDGQVVDPMNWL